MAQQGYPDRDPNQAPQYGTQNQPPPGYGPPDQSAYPSAPPPGYGQPGQGYGQPGQGYGQPGQAPGYGQTGQGRPGMVTTAAVLAFVSGGLGLLANLVAFSIIGTFGVPGFLVVLIVLGLVVAIGLIFGGVLALQGKSFVILLAVAGAAILVNLITMIIYFQATSVLGLIIPVLIIVFLMNPQSKAWIKARGGATLG